MQEEHAASFGTWDHYSTAKLVKLCDQFNECRILRTLVGGPQCESISDIGCATGRFYRYIRKLLPGIEYKGFDISESAISLGKNRNPKGDFRVLAGPLTSIEGVNSDIVFCRDVVHHQEDPRLFLSELYNITGTYLILRVRTREVGSTEFDFSQSCQYTYGRWVPYIVFQTQELIHLLSSLEPTPTAISVRRHPVVLGGQLNRFVPKELYYPETGTAETAVLIHKGRDGKNRAPVVTVETHPEERLREWPWARKIARKLGV